MLKYILSFLVVLVLLVLPFDVYSLAMGMGMGMGPPSPPCGTPPFPPCAVPVDGGIGLVGALGAYLGYKKLTRKSSIKNPA